MFGNPPKSHYLELNHATILLFKRVFSMLDRKNGSVGSSEIGLNDVVKGFTVAPNRRAQAC